MNSNIFMDNNQMLPCNKNIKGVKKSNSSSIIVKFCKQIITFNELCVICNKNI